MRTLFIVVIITYHLIFFVQGSTGDTILWTWETIQETLSWSIIYSGSTQTWDMAYVADEYNVLFDEIYAVADEEYPEYIELFSPVWYSGYIEIVGGGHGWASIEVGVDIVSWSRILLIEAYAPVFSGKEYIIVPSLSLTNTGEELILYGQDRQHLDTLVYPTLKNKQSAYISRVLWEDMFIFFGDPSPWIELIVWPISDNDAWWEVLPEEETDTIPQEISCFIQTQHTTPLVLWKKANLVAVVNSKMLTNASSYMCSRHFEGTSFTSTVCNPSWYAYDFSGTHNITLRVSSSQGAICETNTNISVNKKTVSAISSQNEFSWATWSSSISRKEKYMNIGKTLKEYGRVITWSWTIEWLTYHPVLPPFTYTHLSTGFIISWLLPNPNGVDTGSEGLRIHNMTQTWLSLSWRSIFNGKQHKQLPFTSFLPYQEVLFTGSFQLLNKPHCVALAHGKEIYKPFCYPKANSWQRYHTWLHLTGGQDLFETNKLLTSIDIQVMDTQACVSSNNKILSCRTFPFSLADAKQRKKDAKKLSSIIKKEEEQRSRAENRKEKYHLQVAKRRLLEEKHSLELDELRKNITQANAMRAWFADWWYLLHDIWWDTWWSHYPSVSLYTPIAFMLAWTKNTQNAVSSAYTAVWSSHTDVSAYYARHAQNTIPLSAERIDIWYALLFKETQDTIDSFLKNLTLKTYK